MIRRFAQKYADHAALAVLATLAVLLWSGHEPDDSILLPFAYTIFFLVGRHFL